MRAVSACQPHEIAKHGLAGGARVVENSQEARHQIVDKIESSEVDDEFGGGCVYGTDDVM
jgi:hypothetical protein